MEDTTTAKSILERLKTGTGSKSDSELGRILGVSQQAIYNSRNNNKLPDSWVRKAAQSFDLSSDWLFFERGPMRPEEITSPALVPPTDTTKCETDIVFIPRVTARLAAGTGSLETDGDVRGHYAFRSDWVHRKGNPKSMVLMDVTGDSMIPKIENGDMVLIDQSNTKIVAYGFYAIAVDDAVFVKQLRPRPGQLVLHSLNPDYDDIIVNMAAEHPQDVHIIGRVLWVGRELS